MSRVAVIGAGVVGAAIARALAEAGHRVSLIAGAIAAEIAGDAPDPMLRHYRPDRPAVAGAAP